MTVDVTVLAYLLAAVSVYYMGLFVLSHLPHRREKLANPPLFIIIIPAHNEAAVIAATLDRLLASRYERKMILVMDDGSTDRTAAIVREYASRNVQIVSRPAEVAGQGKGAVLNHAFELVCDPRIVGRNADGIVLGVLDADGQLDTNAMASVAPYFADPRVGGVQIGVRIVNATDGLLERAQDMEFVGFSGFVQTARDWTGSVGLGGNGQFTRVSALRSLGSKPWSDCLTEDLDLGLSLVERGWRIRFCPDVFVAQEGLNRVRPLLRQRTRWIQGHYQCWKHLPRLARARRVPWRTKLDLSLYLCLLILVTAFAANAALGFLQLFGLVELHNGLLDRVGSGFAQRLLTVLLSVGPPACFMWTYQRRARSALRWWEVPAATLYFTAYTYLFVISQVRAWVRIARGHNGWAKTQRVAAESAAAH